MATLKTSDDVLLEMVETLECPVCLNTIWKPPIYRCENDHIFCGDCDAKLRGEGKHCPVCRQRILGKRALAVEQMVSKLVFYKCENSGCNFTAPLTGVMDYHKHCCEFRLIDCYVCSARVTVKDLPDHLKNVHVHNTAKDFQGAGPHVKRYLTKSAQDPPLSWTSIERTGAGGARFLFFRLLFSGSVRAKRKLKALSTPSPSSVGKERTKGRPSDWQSTLDCAHRWTCLWKPSRRNNRACLWLKAFWAKLLMEVAASTAKWRSVWPNKTGTWTNKKVSSLSSKSAS